MTKLYPQSTAQASSHSPHLLDDIEYLITQQHFTREVLAGDTVKNGEPMGLCRTSARALNAPVAVLSAPAQALEEQAHADPPSRTEAAMPRRQGQLLQTAPSTARSP